MLRRTAARAFGAGAAHSDVPPAPHQTDRSAAVERLFGDLHRRLTERVDRLPRDSEPAGSEEPHPDDGGDADEAFERGSESSGPDSAGGASALEVTRPRALPEGVEFALIGPSYTCRFVNTLTGFIRVSAHAFESGKLMADPVRAEVLSVHPYWGTLRPILKPLGHGSGGTRAERTAFCFTSAEELSAHYVDLVRGR